MLKKFVYRANSPATAGLFFVGRAQFFSTDFTHHKAVHNYRPYSKHHTEDAPH